MKEENICERIAKDFDCDAVMCEAQDDSEIVCITPYDTKTGKHVLGMMMITSWQEVMESKIKKVCRKEDKFANKRLNKSRKG